MNVPGSVFLARIAYPAYPREPPRRHAASPGAGDAFTPDAQPVADS